MLGQVKIKDKVSQFDVRNRENFLEKENIVFSMLEDIMLHRAIVSY